MTLSALEVLKKRGGKDGFFMMSEAASVDKQVSNFICVNFLVIKAISQLHTFDFPRAWAELIELDVTIKNTIQWLKKNGEYEDTLILLTADHAHGFDVWGTVDQRYIRTHDGELDMRNSIGVYAQSGFPGYFDKNNDGFPDSFVSFLLVTTIYMYFDLYFLYIQSPKITLAAGTNNGPGHFEAWQTTTNAPRNPTAATSNGDYDGNTKDAAGKNGGKTNIIQHKFTRVLNADNNSWSQVE